MTYPKSNAILQHNRRFIPGGVVSVNRAAKPEVVFTRAAGAYMWDVEGNRYVDYHGAFAAHFLGHNDPHVNRSVQCILNDQSSLFGTGTTSLEGRLAEMICRQVPTVETVQFLNSGSEATSQAIRLARAATGRDHIIVIQGGYNGWHNDVSCNLMTPLAELGPRLSPGEYPYHSLSAGVPAEHKRLVHPLNFNDLDSVEYVCSRYPVAALITEPLLQNIGVIHPKPGYLAGLRALTGRHGFILIFDEVKTGFRHALGGYASIAGVAPDLSVFGKAIANGYPLAVLGGRRELMEYFIHSDPAKRVLLAGTYNAHPISTAAAIATIERLTEDDGAVYRAVDRLGTQIQQGLESIAQRLGITMTVARQGSAFCPYFMDHAPVDWHDLAANHDAELDAAVRQRLISSGVYAFPAAMKQYSISAAHTERDVQETLACFAKSLNEVRQSSARSVTGHTE